MTHATVAALVLAAGRSSRMGGPNKLLATFNGIPLVRRTVMAACASQVSPVIVVTGHTEDAIREALAGLDVTFVRNPDYAEGLATSIKAGLAAAPPTAAGALIILADMPGVTTEVIDSIVDAFTASGGSAIVVPTAAGQRGNPVLWPRRYFGELAAVTGDVGGRELLRRCADAVRTIEIGEAAAFDVDTPEALAAAGGSLTD